MTELLIQIKLIVNNPNVSDDLINLLINKAKKEIETICGIAYIPAMDNVIMDMIIFKINTLNKDGISSINLNDVAKTSYRANYPTYILKQLSTFKKNIYVF